MTTLALPPAQSRGEPSNCWPVTSGWSYRLLGQASRWSKEVGELGSCARPCPSTVPSWRSPAGTTVPPDVRPPAAACFCAEPAMATIPATITTTTTPMTIQGPEIESRHRGRDP